jgi:hypothetical protein
MPIGSRVHGQGLKLARSLRLVIAVEVQARGKTGLLRRVFCSMQQPPAIKLAGGAAGACVWKLIPCATPPCLRRDRRNLVISRFSVT